MGAPSLQDGIDQAGSPMRLLWQVNPAPWNPEGVEPEYAGWRREQAAWQDGVAHIGERGRHVVGEITERRHLAGMPGAFQPRQSAAERSQPEPRCS